jgi:hypothetical protein
VVKPEKFGTEGPLESVIKTCQSIRVSSVGITADGGAANTGHVHRVWKLLEHYVGHGLTTIWCWCHRSDLATESDLEAMPELNSG